ncbi:MAG: hypothetical protein M1587_00250 [Thaumarchaeota archaeon]|nr:hypothetical protein [Nitrososphaerota archaeon]
MKYSIVERLQEAITANEQSITQMLREAKLIAAKLNLHDIEQWVNLELNGYPSDVKSPSYRKFSTSGLEIRNPVRGWTFAGYPQRTLIARQPIAEIETLSEGHTLTMAVTKNYPVTDAAGSSFGSDWPQRLIIDPNQFKYIIEAVNNELVEWTVELDRRGIRGEGVEFNEKERHLATKQVFNIQKFAGVIGDLVASEVNLYDYQSIHQMLKDHEVPQFERNELENIMDDLKSAKTKGKDDLLKRGRAWISRNKRFLGDATEIIMRAIGAAMK